MGCVSRWVELVAVTYRGPYLSWMGMGKKDRQAQKGILGFHKVTPLVTG